jgi:hypothetical protein
LLPCICVLQLLNSTHHLLNYTNLSLAENSWLCLSPSLSQVLAPPMDSLGTSPSKISGLPLARPYIAKVKLTHPAPQCLQSLHGWRPLGKIPKELCVKITLSNILSSVFALSWNSFWNCSLCLPASRLKGSLHSSPSNPTSQYYP